MAINFGNASTLANVGTASWRVHTAFTGNAAPISCLLYTSDAADE